MHRDKITGLILAGGRAQRMGGIDKGLTELRGRPMVAHVVQRISPQVSHIVINANRNLDRYHEWSDAVIKDQFGDFAGPLAGVASGLGVAQTDLVLTVPCDSPLVSENYADRMYHQMLEEQSDIAVASDGNRIQPVFMLLRRTLLPSVQAFLERGERKIDRWYAEHTLSTVDFSDDPNTFLNINTLSEKEALASDPQVGD